MLTPEIYKQIASLASTAMVSYGAAEFDVRDPERYKLFDYALRSKYARSDDLDFILDTVEELATENLSPKLKYQIGKMLTNINSDAFPNFDTNQVEANFVEFYNAQNERACEAATVWTLCAKQGNLVHKDIIRVIGAKIWDMRCDADYVLATLEN